MRVPLRWYAGGNVSAIGILSILPPFPKRHQEGCCREIAAAMGSFRTSTLEIARGRCELATLQRERVATPLYLLRCFNMVVFSGKNRHVARWRVWAQSRGGEYSRH